MIAVFRWRVPWLCIGTASTSCKQMEGLSGMPPPPMLRADVTFLEAGIGHQSFRAGGGADGEFVLYTPAIVSEDFKLIRWIEFRVFSRKRMLPTSAYIAPIS